MEDNGRGYKGKRDIYSPLKHKRGIGMENNSRLKQPRAWAIKEWVISWDEANRVEKNTKVSVLRLRQCRDG